MTETLNFIDRDSVEEVNPERDDQYRIVLEAMRVGIIFSDESGHFWVFNSEMEKLTGYSVDEANACSDFTLLLYPDIKDCEQVLDGLNNLVKPGDIYETKTIICTKNGTYRTVFVSTTLILYKGHRMFLSTYYDITGSEQVEEALAKVAAEQKNIMETVSDGVYMLDMNGNLVSWNREVDEVTGLSAEELMDKPIVEFFAEEDRAAVAEAITKGLEEGTGEVTGSFLRKDRPPAIYQWSVVPLKDPQGNVIGLTGVGRDITERKHIEEALAKVAAEQKNIMETVSDGVYMLDMNGNLVSWNREVDEVTGLSAEELMDKPIVEFFAEEDRAAVAEAITKGLEEGTGEVTGSFLRKDRPPAIYQWSVVPLKDPQGNVIGLTGVGRDITERKHIEEALRESEEKYRDLLENANDLIQSVAPDGHFVYVNRAWRNNLGYIEEEIADLSLFDIIHPDSQAHCTEVFQRVMSGEKVDNVEAVFVAKDGKEISVAGNVNCKFVDGKSVYTRGIFHDITERKQAEEELAKIAAEQKNIMGTISDGIYMLDMSGNLVNWNRAAEVVTGLSAKELTGKPIVELFAEEDRAAVAEAIRKGLEEGIGEVTGSFLRKDCPPAIYQWSTVPLKDPQGKVIGLTGVGRDITERKEMEKKIKKRNEQLGMTNLDLNSMNRELTATNEELLSTQDELKESRGSIERQNVKLEKKIDELERYKKVTVGRELKMIELKKRMKELEENKMNRR